MLLKVWVKQSGMTDDEALGIHVPADGTAQTVVEACRGVFRNLSSSQVTLRTEEGIIVALASPASALRNHTLELILMPLAGAAKGSTTTASARVKGKRFARQQSSVQRVDCIRPGISASSTGPLQKRSVNRSHHERQEDRSVNKGKKPVDFGQALALLWDSLPVFTPQLPGMSLPTITSALRGSRCVLPPAFLGLCDNAEDRCPCPSPSVKATEDRLENQVVMPSEYADSPNPSMCMDAVMDDKGNCNSFLSRNDFCGTRGIQAAEQMEAPSCTAAPLAALTATETSTPRVAEEVEREALSSSLEKGGTSLGLTAIPEAPCKAFDENERCNSDSKHPEIQEGFSKTGELDECGPTIIFPCESLKYFNEW